MDKLESQTSKEAAWRNHLARHAASGKSIGAFCRDEPISEGNFHAWRTKLRDGAVDLPVPPPRATFIDLGAANSAVASRAAEHSPTPALAIRLACHSDGKRKLAVQLDGTGRQACWHRAEPAGHMPAARH